MGPRWVKFDVNACRCECRTVRACDGRNSTFFTVPAPVTLSDVKKTVLWSGRFEQAQFRQAWREGVIFTVGLPPADIELTYPIPVTLTRQLPKITDL